MKERDLLKKQKTGEWRSNIPYIVSRSTVQSRSFFLEKFFFLYFYRFDKSLSLCYFLFNQNNSAAQTGSSFFGLNIDN